MTNQELERAVWARSEQLQGEIAKQLRNWLGEPAYDESMFTEEIRAKRIAQLQASAQTLLDEDACRQRHSQWVASYQADGWKPGDNYDPTNKTHPNLVPYDELPASNRMKAKIFMLVAHHAQSICQLLSGDTSDESVSSTGAGVTSEPPDS